MRLDDAPESGNVEDRRGIAPVAAGGGIIGLIIMAAVYFLTGDPNQAKRAAQIAGDRQQAAQREGPAPKDGAKEFSEKILGYTNEVWRDQFREHGHRSYDPPKMVLFRTAVDTGCGHAPSEVGPFYCPADKIVYLDPTFFDELEQRLGGSKADFSKAYVIAHEVGHHVQNLIGYNALEEKFRPREGENAGVRLELQADYLAGVCWHHVEKKHHVLEKGDVEAALTTARAIGDDRLQKRARGTVRPDSFTHGTSEQRLRWFKDGLETGDASKKKLDHFFDPNVNPLKL
jgi:predicted metalloprotease